MLVQPPSPLQTIEKKDAPGLVTCWSNPKRIRLEAAGVVLGARLYRDALGREKVEVGARPHLGARL